ncbi:hypothetical protein AB395_00005507 (plasmid) [Sinorhizobium fredii CCBAU 45436]|nr:hypothetical protein AB395_00005507 [Sinorhizobium fredii CCBAU 45436]
MTSQASGDDYRRLRSTFPLKSNGRGATTEKLPPSNRRKSAPR